jgi:hypothetical protein
MALTLLSLLLASCSGRPATPEYFTKVTRVPLCSGASVRNLNADAPDRSPGFDSIYIVDVTIPAECEAAFYSAVAQQIGSSCDPASGCSGYSSNGDFYQVERHQNWLRVTHST